MHLRPRSRRRLGRERSCTARPRWSEANILRESPTREASTQYLLARLLNCAIAHALSRRVAFWSATRVFVMFLVLFEFSKAAQAAEFNFGFEGPPRPSQEATLIVKDYVTEPNMVATMFGGVHWIASVCSVDNKRRDNSGNQIAAGPGFVTIWMRGSTCNSSCYSDCTIRLLPGEHIIEVRFWSQWGIYAKTSSFQKFTARPGRKYQVFLHIYYSSGLSPPPWSASIGEVKQ